MIKLLNFLIFFICLNVSAQSLINGNVKNQNNEPIRYCSLGIKDSKIGAITDENGKYSFKIPENIKSDITFQAAGYTPKTISGADLKLNSKVILDYSIKNIEEVSLNATKMKEKIIGQKSRPLLTFSKMFDENVPTIEQGSIFPVYQKTKLQSYSFYIIPSSKFEQITLKLNLYNVKNNLPNEPILEENIIYIPKTTGWQTIDLSNYHIKLKDLDEIALTLQLINFKPIKDTDFIFGISAKKTLGKNLLFRYQSMGNWEENEGSFISNIKIRYSKTKDEKDKNQNYEEIAVKDMKTENLINFYKNQESAKKRFTVKIKTENTLM